MKNTVLNCAKLGNNIRTRRLANTLTQAELAKRADCSPTTISRLERGLCAPSADLLFDLARELHCRASELVEGV